MTQDEDRGSVANPPASARLAARGRTLLLPVLAGFCLVAGWSRSVWAIGLAALLVALAIGFLVRGRRAPLDESAAAASAGGFERLSAASLAAAMPEPLLLVDANGAIVHANEPARAAFGSLGTGTLVQLRFRTPEVQALVGRLLAGEGGPHVCDYAEKVPIERWFRVAGLPVGEGSGLFVLAFRDQSDIRRIDRMRADFIANASHELRTPLASVAGFIETLRGPARNDARARDHFLQIMQEQTGRMARLIDDLLSLSRLEMKPSAAASETIDLNQLVGGVVDALRHFADESGVSVDLRRSGTPAEVRGHRDELIQVMENLLENACKYGQSGGRVDVVVEAAGNGEGPRVTVRDYGPGIPGEHIPRITERFYRVDVETSRAQKGTGLGLAIVKHILTRHNARLVVRSQVGEGASFTVQFPAA